MKHLYAAAQLIESQGIAETGVNLFVGTTPADVAIAIELRDPLYGAELDEELEGFTKHDFQIIARHKYSEEAYDLAWRAAQALKVSNLQADGVFIRKMHALQLPVTYPKMESDELEVSVRIRVWFALG